MNHMGISRKIDGLGRIVIPKEIRHEFGWSDRELIDIIPFGQYVILQAHGTGKQPKSKPDLKNPIYDDIILGLHALQNNDLLWVSQIIQRFRETGERTALHGPDCPDN